MKARTRNRSNQQKASGRLPSVLIVGFQKCATSAVYRLLVRHPDISGAVRWDPRAVGWPPKELHFFDRDVNFRRGAPWYASHFAGEPSHAIEGTPEYLVSEKAVQRMFRTVPDAKLIVMVRDPVKRAHSAWNHWNQLPPENRWPVFEPEKNFRANIESELRELQRNQFYSGFLSRGFYIDQIERVKRFFPENQIHVGFAEHLMKGSGAIDRLQRFIGISPADLGERKAHVRKYDSAPIDEATISFLRNIYQPYDERLADHLGTKLPWAY